MNKIEHIVEVVYIKEVSFAWARKNEVRRSIGQPTAAARREIAACAVSTSQGTGQGLFWLLLFVPANSPIAKRKSIPFKKLADLQLVLPGPPNVFRTVIERIAARLNITLNVKECDSLPAIARLVCHAEFMAVMPHFTFVDEMQRGELVAVPIVDPVPAWTLSVVVSQRTMNKRASEAVALVMAEMISDMVGDGTWRAKLRGKKIVRKPS